MSSWSARAPRSLKQSPQKPAATHNERKLTFGNTGVADQFNRAVRNLNPAQQAIVNEMGLLSFTSALRVYNFDHRFTEWLFTRFGHMNQFFVETPSPYTISPDDVAKVFGLANHGKSVITSVRDKSFETKEVIRRRLMHQASDESWLAASARVVRTTTEICTDEDPDRFTMAFAVYTLSVLLEDLDTSNYIPALKVASDFKKFIWADFVFHEITIEALKARSYRSSGKPFWPGFGATIFAHVSPLPSTVIFSASSCTL
jgi:hypothetical protein